MATPFGPERSSQPEVFPRPGRSAFDPPNLLLTTLKVAAAVIIIAERSTTFTDFKPIRQPGVEGPPNTLLTVLSQSPALAVAVKAPFNQLDWINPTKKIGFKTPESFRPPSRETAVPETPFSQENWPNPIRIRAREFGWINFANIGDIPLVIPESQPAPRSTVFTEYYKPPVQQGWLWRANIGDIPSVVPAVAPASPFSQEDWVNPQKPWIRDLNWSQSPQVQQIIPDPAGKDKPFLQNEWPNPVLRVFFKESGWVWHPNIGDIPAAAAPLPPVIVGEIKFGGRGHEYMARQRFVEKLKKLKVPDEAIEIIEQIAEKQALETVFESDSEKQERELIHTLRKNFIADDVRYQALLAERREQLKNEEIGALLYKTFRDEEDILTLLIIAAQL